MEVGCIGLFCAVTMVVSYAAIMVTYLSLLATGLGHNRYWMFAEVWSYNSGGSY